MVAFTTLIVMVAIEIGAQNHLMQSRAENLRVARNAFDGEIDSLVNAANITTTYSLPTTLNVTIGSVPGSYVITDNNASITGTVLVKGTLSYGGESYAFSKIIGDGVTFVANLGPWNDALFDDGDLNIVSKIIVGSSSVPASAYTAGSLNANATGSVFWKDLSVVYNINGSAITVHGTKYNPASTQTFPSINGNTYQSAAYSNNYSNNVTINGLTFPTVSGSSDYPIYCYASNINLSGQISGRGIIFAWNNVVISGNVTYAANSSLVLITTNGVTVNSGVTQVSGYIYCGSQFDCAGSTTITGSVVAASFSVNGTDTFLYDDYIGTHAGEAKRLCLPGLWP